MSYFLPTFLQKRILRYALSRLELLNTDALDLENLDIAWGRKSTVKLRDVGVHVEKISALLKLPRNFTIKRARISTLRITIPADLYKSSILLEIEGFDISIRADTSDREEPATTKKEGVWESRPRKPSKTVKANRPRHTPPIVHDPGGWPDSDESTEEEEEEGGPLPTTFDLAQSFVQAEPTEEKSELQAAVAQSLHLNQSQTSSEDGLDASELGIGNEVYLPAFLAGFLKGVGDRVQVDVKNVKVDLDLNLTNKDDTQSIEDVKLRLMVGSIFVDEVLQNAAGIQTRRFQVETIDLLIISEPSLFSYLARSTAPSSPETTQASATLAARRPSTESSQSMPNANVQAENPEQSVANLSLSQASNLSVQEDTLDDEEKAPASSVSQLEDHATANQSHYEDSMFSDSFYSSGGHSVTENDVTEDFQALRDSSIFGTAFDATASMRVPRKPDASQEFSDARDSPPATFAAFPPPSLRDTIAPNDVRNPHRQARDTNDLTISAEYSDRSLSRHPSSEGRPSSSSAENLSESKIFSHEEAESMYMSAMSSKPLHESARSSNASESSDPSSKAKDKQIAEHQGSKVLRNKNELGNPPRFATSENTDQVSAFNEANELDRSRTPTNMPTADQELQATLNSNIDPAIRPGMATADNNASLFPNSGSQASSGRDQLLTSKRILLIDEICLKLPIRNSQATPQTSDALGTPGVVEGMPAAKLEGGLGTSSIGASKDDKAQAANTLSPAESTEQATAIKIGSVQIVSDISLTKLALLLMEKLRAAHESSPPHKTRSGSPNTSYESHYTLVVNSISWKFLDLVKGSLVSDSAPIEAHSKATTLSEGCDVFLRSEISSLQMVYASTKYKTVTKFAISKFLIGYASNNILSFDAGLKSKNHSREDSSSADKDVNAIIIETKGILSIDITTLPVHLTLDLRRLDETFGWFGGFSSMLGLGSSMVSTVTLLDPKVKFLSAKKPSRGVHFESPTTESPPIQTASTMSQQQKITARIGGLIFDLQGTKAAVQLDSTAMKLVSRTEGVGLQIDRLVLAGPVNINANADPPAFVKLSNVRIEYLTTPKENDLTRLLTLLAPSKNTYDDGDDILVDTLIRQRRKGGVLRATVESTRIQMLGSNALQCFPLLAEEAKKLSTVAKYLPEDDRPGVLTLTLLKSMKADIHANDIFGIVSLDAVNVEIAHVTFPTLFALGVSDCNLSRNSTEELIHKALPSNADAALQAPPPILMARFIGNEMEPTIKIKLHNAQFEYHVTTILAVMEMNDNAATDELVSGIASSVATLTSRRSVKSSPPKISRQESGSSNHSFGGSRALKFDIVFRDSVLGLNPRVSQAKGLVVLTDTHFIGSMPRGQDASATLEIRKAELMIIDDVGNVREKGPLYSQKAVESRNSQVQALAETGYVSISQISAAKVVLQVAQSKVDSGPAIDVEIRDDLFVIESCADSTQTITNILNGLTPPMPKSSALKYQTEVVPVEDMLASFSGDAFDFARANQSDSAEKEALDLEEGDMMEDEVPQNLEFVSSFYNPDPEASMSETVGDSVLDNDLDSIATRSVLREIGDKNLLESFQEQTQVAPGQTPLDFKNDHFGSDSTVGGTAHDWSQQHDENSPMKGKVLRSPLRVRVRDVHVIWNLFDGYDWQHTRDAISQAVAEVQHKAVERQAARKRKSFDPEDEDEDVIGDFLFNSIYIGIPAKSDPAELTRQVNRNIDDLISETGSYATSTSAGASPSRALPAKPKGKRLRLHRSKHHKLTFELRGVCADAVVCPPGSGEIQSSVDVRVQDLDIFDHVPTSTWKKFATYMHDAGERESGSSMIHIHIDNVKPVPDLAASEIVLKASILPLRLHVDQDALDFMTRFFDFKGDSALDPTASKSEVPFIQRAEIKSIRVRLDFKPKRVDYAGLRSGRTTEFMNFFVLDSADMVLRHAIIYGVSGFDRLGKTLNDIWMPDIKQNQLPGVLAGIAPVRSLVNVGGGVRDLVVVPIREYRKDGRIVRSFQKGALAFAKTTTSELMRLGAKLAIGTQTVLQGAEDLLSQPTVSHQRLDIAAGWEDSDLDEDEKKRISLYADQPVGVVQGLKGAYASLERDLLTARDAVVAMPGEIMESGNAGDAARAVLRGAPTVILRPAMGVSKAVGQTLMGATNSLDPGNKRRIEDKYKKY